MDTNSALDHIISRCTSVTQEVYDGKVLKYSDELTPEEYVALMAGHLYDKHVAGYKGLRLRMVTDHYLGVHYVGTVSHGNGCKTVYTIHY